MTIIAKEGRGEGGRQAIASAFSMQIKQSLELLHKIPECQAVITAVSFSEYSFKWTSYHTVPQVFWSFNETLYYKNFNHAPVEGSDKNASVALDENTHSADFLIFLV